MSKYFLLTKIGELNQMHDLKNQKGTRGRDREIIPNDTRLMCAYKYNFDKKCIELHLKTNNTSVIRGIIINGEKLFKVDSLAYSNPISKDVFVFPIITKDNQEVE